MNDTLNRLVAERLGYTVAQDEAGHWWLYEGGSPVLVVANAKRRSTEVRAWERLFDFHVLPAWGRDLESTLALPFGGLVKIHLLDHMVRLTYDGVHVIPPPASLGQLAESLAQLFLNQTEGL